jgi:hypothetical protein
MLSAVTSSSLLRLDSFSCLLTVISTVLVGRKLWQGWVVAALNSLIICIIGLQTAQFGFIPANLFCVVLYAHNLTIWRRTLTSETANHWTFALKKAAVFPVRPAPRIAGETKDENAGIGTLDCNPSTASWMVQALHCPPGLKPAFPESRSLSFLS